MSLDTGLISTPTVKKINNSVSMSKINIMENTCIKKKKHGTRLCSVKLQNEGLVFPNNCIIPTTTAAYHIKLVAMAGKVEVKLSLQSLQISS